MEQIGVRELRQNASRYLQKVAAGESIMVTDRGVPVALLTPPRQGEGLWERLIASGELVPAERPSGILSGDMPLEPLDLGFSASAELQRLRDEERW